MLLMLLTGGEVQAQDTVDDKAPGSYGMIYCEAKDVRYPITAKDALWAARMLVGEAGGQDDVNNEAVLWCMLNSYCLRPLRDKYPTFKSFIRAYCTPLQPYLKSKGAIERHRKRGTPMEEVEPGRWQLTRHLKLQRRSWDKLSEGARAIVVRVLRGESDSVCGNATQFCSTAIFFRDRHDRRPTDDEHKTFTEEFAKKKKWSWFIPKDSNVRENCFFEELRFSNVPRPAVRVLRPKKRHAPRRR
ncbi:hypothetical protein ACFL59_00065 [Planctomycetota bacterium]